MRIDRSTQETRSISTVLALMGVDVIDVADASEGALLSPTHRGSVSIYVTALRNGDEPWEEPTLSLEMSDFTREEFHALQPHIDRLFAKYRETFGGKDT